MPDSPVEKTLISKAFLRAHFSHPPKPLLRLHYWGFSVGRLAVLISVSPVAEQNCWNLKKKGFQIIWKLFLFIK